MLDIVLSYPAAGSAMLGPMAQNWFAEGSHSNFKYEYFDDTRRGMGAGVNLPAPDLQPMILNNESVPSGQSVEGHICLQVASKDASTLLLKTAPRRHGRRFDVWLALRP